MKKHTITLIICCVITWIIGIVIGLNIRSIGGIVKKNELADVAKKEDFTDVITRELPIEMVGLWYSGLPIRLMFETNRDGYRIAQSRLTVNGRPADGKPLSGGPIEYWPQMTIRRNTAGELIKVIMHRKDRGCNEIYRSIPLDLKVSRPNAIYAFHLASLPVDRGTGMPIGEPENSYFDINVVR